MKISVSKNEMAEWIREVGEHSLMLTISEPHARAHHLKLGVSEMEPIISKIIKLANSFVFSKHKHYEFLDGVIVCQHANKQPHFHIVFKKPEKIDLNVFKRKLTKVADMLCKEDFKFDLSDEFLSSKVKLFLTFPCYNRFAKVTDTHENIGSYLTRLEHKSTTMYFLLKDRKVNFKNDKIDLHINFENEKKEIQRTEYQSQGGQYAY